MKPRRIATSLLLAAATVLNFPACAAAADNEGSLESFQKCYSFSASTFTDVDESGWFYSNIKSVYEYGLMVGNSATTFNPNGNITIAEAIVIADHIHALYHTGSAEFEEGSPWYAPYVTYAEKVGIITAGEYEYDAVARRSEFAAILATALPKEELKEINTIEDNSIPDVSAAAQNAEAIYLLYRAGVLTGVDDAGTFLPDSTIKRSEAATIVSKMIEPNSRVVKETGCADASEPFWTEGTPKSDQERNTTSSEEDAAAKGDSYESSKSPEQERTQPDEPTFVIQTVSASPGDEKVPVTIGVLGNPGISSIGLLVSYDPALKLESIVYNETIGGMNMQPESMSNPVMLVWISPFENVDGDWTFVTLYFDVPDAEDSKFYQIFATYDPEDIYDMSEDNIDFQVVNGAIKVE